MSNQIEIMQDGIAADRGDELYFVRLTMGLGLWVDRWSEASGSNVLWTGKTREIARGTHAECVAAADAYCAAHPADAIRVRDWGEHRFPVATPSYRAAYWTGVDGQASIVLTTREQQHLSDAELMAAAGAVAAEQGLDATGTITVGDWTE